MPDFQILMKIIQGACLGMRSHALANRRARGHSTALALRKTPSLLVSRTLAPSLAVTLIVSIPISDIGSQPAQLLTAVTASAVAIAAGVRGMLWTLPWVYFVAFEPIVTQSAAVDPRTNWAVPNTAALLVVSITLLGLANSTLGPGSWWQYLARPLPTKAVDNVDRGSGGVVSARRDGTDLNFI